MRMKILGSAAGGGLPQWNCNYYLSRAARSGLAGIHKRTQSSAAVSADGAAWVLFNVSPDIRQQIAETAVLQPSVNSQLRSTPIRAVVLTNADVDHIAGLLSLRERQPFAIYATVQVLAALDANSIFNVLDPELVPRRLLPLAEEVAIRDAEGLETGVTVECFPVSGKIALYLEDRQHPHANFSSNAGDTIGIRVAGGTAGGAVFYIPGCASIDAVLRAMLTDAYCLLFDGTVHADNELIAAGVSHKSGVRMGHLAMSGNAGSIAALADLNISRRVFIHINNTNPVLDENSAEYMSVRAAGWEVARDGMEIEF
ncbi:pyrroloquinoline quinone biosynthesis protein PqqB [Mesorhizobium sp. INR15]|uniref:pyrroloquinoline quinone biosynthesis protein PqqB n=1 Tax=Mesorhizobium sp. INR15 TaxID=2654248 RepID=UPI0018968CBF|nr:pyrroloquinoline quinone biosynthesis protein PqqB [Mesorhizobium sp. INR15]QPC95380.1 pyrroloquinoline quinone biosynthesis protein PqqB [Mesorhizobium sp. INR15]QPC95658.1 pyrroloquinoline quinone biosynthesis protein PqqB [Mesorhizobium sp. INR15]QPC95699.1 pyrroloquinoline quinone biosynthesis protein PqqB [Mesorhizobium sp. INR15]QPC95992.1 pyrroloquinoline quinone biosynthesis protein PqqB [Mesorhizobium sp. INR15]